MRSGEKRWREEKKSRREKHKRGDCGTSSVTSATDEAGVYEFSSVTRSQTHSFIQITREREPGKLLAPGMQQIKRFLAQRGGTSGENDEDDLASGVLQ